MGLGNLKAPRGVRKKRKRVGRGSGSGMGGTAGRGHKGQLARSGAKIGVGFEGGQMPLQRRMPKRGFTNFCRHKYTVVHLRDLARFEENRVVDPEAMRNSGLIHRVTDPVKILADGELGKPLAVRAQAFSRAAKEKIEAAGGRVEVIARVRKTVTSVPHQEG